MLEKEQGREREREREREKLRCKTETSISTSYMRPDQVSNGNLTMCPDLGLNLQTVCVWCVYVYRMTL